ncbi:MAG: hypothetical protein CSA75_04020 [Sorangium cellulosum]|nr:MAG: hypothetical protein CSA75_04020 [Sorangium cellulosum]
MARQAKPVGIDQLRPGDFFIVPGNPGHTVLVLDLAEDHKDRRVVLIGQSYIPAQSFHVLRSGPFGAWFPMEPEEGGMKTPFWPNPFPWSSLRRLE